MSDVVIVSAGVRCPVGLNAKQTAFLIRAGFPAMAEAPLASAEGKPITMAFVPTIDGALTGVDRTVELCRAPLAEAAAPLADLSKEILIAVDEGAPETPLLTRLLDTAAKGLVPGARVRIEPRGEAAPGAMIQTAIQTLSTRRADAVIIGGVHSDYDPRLIAALEAQGRLFTPENLDARIPGEAAAFFVLMREKDAARRRLSPLARVLGVGEGKERARPDNDAHAYEAMGLTAAVRQATKTLADSGGKAGWLLTDLTFEMWRQYEWQSAWVRSQKVLGDPYIIESPAQRIGYLGAAALPFFAALSATAWDHGLAPSPTALLLTGNDSGARAVLLLEKA